MQATINYLPEIPEPEMLMNFRGLKCCYVIELPNVIVYSLNRDKCICKAKAISKLLPQLKKCDQ